MFYVAVFLSDEAFADADKCPEKSVFFFSTRVFGRELSYVLIGVGVTFLRKIRRQKRNELLKYFTADSLLSLSVQISLSTTKAFLHFLVKKWNGIEIASFANG